jgi:hypothetical protein
MWQCESCVGSKKKMIGQMFDCEDVGIINEYVGCKIDRDLDEPSLRMTQPVLLQSFEDEFDLTEMDKPGMPAPAGSVLSKVDKTKCEAVPLAQQAYRKVVSKKWLHMTRWTRPEIMNAVRELLRFAGGALMGHMKAMYRVMAYCGVSTLKREIKIKPNEKWNGSPEFEFTIGGRADSDYAKDLETRPCVSGIITFLCGAVITL